MIIDVLLYEAGESPGKARAPAESKGQKLGRPGKAQPTNCTNRAKAEAEEPNFGRLGGLARGLEARDDFVLRLYLRDLGRVMTPGPAGAAPEAGGLPPEDSARQQLVLGHLPRVVRMAFDYQGFGLPLGDLISEGNFGLMRAAELFDPARNVRFACYAKPWIRVQMQRALSYQAWPVSLPADFSWRHGQVEGAEARLTAKLNREPTDTELAGECGLELPAVRRLRGTPAPSFVPLESPGPGNETELTLAEVIPDENSPAPDLEAARNSDRELVERLLTALTPDEQRVIRLRFGLDDGCTRTFEEVGRLLGYCRQGVHRLQTVALGKLRQRARFLHVSAPAGRGSPGGRVGG